MADRKFVRIKRKLEIESAPDEEGADDERA